MKLADFLSHFDRPRRTSRGWLAKCPAHADRRPSLGIAEGDSGRILLKCWTGCSAAEIVAAMGLSMRDLFADEMPSRDAMRRVRARKAETERAARGIDISIWDSDKLDLMMNVVCDAHKILIAERDSNYVRNGYY